MNGKQCILLFVTSLLLVISNVASYNKVQTNSSDERNVKTEYTDINKTVEEKSIEQIPQRQVLDAKIKEYYLRNRLHPPRHMNTHTLRNLKKLSDTCYEFGVFVEYDLGTAMDNDIIYFLLEHDEQNGWEIDEMAYNKPPEDWERYSLKRALAISVLNWATENYKDIFGHRIINFGQIDDNTANVTARFKQTIWKQAYSEVIETHGKFILKKDSKSKWIVKSMEELDRILIAKQKIYEK